MDLGTLISEISATDEPYLGKEINLVEYFIFKLNPAECLSQQDCFLRVNSRLVVNAVVMIVQVQKVNPFNEILLVLIRIKL